MSHKLSINYRFAETLHQGAQVALPAHKCTGNAGREQQVTIHIFILSPLIEGFYNVKHDHGLDTASCSLQRLQELKPCLEENIEKEDGVYPTALMN